MKRREFIQDGAITAATVVVAGTMGCATGKVSTDQQAEMSEAELLPSEAEVILEDPASFVPWAATWRVSRVLALLLTAGTLASVHGGAGSAEGATSPAGVPQSDTALSGEIWANVPVPGEQPDEVPFTIMEMVYRAAPVLWFSQRDPLLSSGKAPPEAIPLSPTVGRTGYFLLREVELVESLLPGQQALATRDLNAVWSTDARELPIGLLKSITVRYVFYYSEDYGFSRGDDRTRGAGAHVHDVESVEISLEVSRIVRSGQNGMAVRIARVAGHAHGSGWYTNELVVDEPIALPVRVLIEQGKHSTSPDRDGNGHYVAGYDVNRHPRDAWGTRDVYDVEIPGGVGEVVAKFVRMAAFRSYMATPRHEATQVFPGRAGLTTLGSKRTYELVSAGADSDLCRDLTDMTSTVQPGRLAPAKEPTRLARALNAMRFCERAAFVAGRPWAAIKKALTGAAYSRPYQRKSDKFGLAARFDGNLGLTAAVPLRDVPVVGGWVLLRASWVGDEGSVDLEYQPSATRLAEWYVSVGVAPSVAAEGGIKIRLPLPPLPLLSARFGLRTAAGGLDTLRFVGAIGIGPW
ncbi:MAG: hypothetical protein ABGY72_07690 [bacterium]